MTRTSPRTVASALYAALDHYTSVLSTPHADLAAWRRRLFRAKSAVAVLSRIAEAGARERRDRLN